LHSLPHRSYNLDKCIPSSPLLLASNTFLVRADLRPVIFYIVATCQSRQISRTQPQGLTLVHTSMACRERLKWEWLSDSNSAGSQKDTRRGTGHRACPNNESKSIPLVVQDRHHEGSGRMLVVKTTLWPRKFIHRWLTTQRLVEDRTIIIS